MNSRLHSRLTVPHASSLRLSLPRSGRGRPVLRPLLHAHSSSTLLLVSFQSLTNCPRFATLSEPLSFQPITHCPICKSFVLILMQQCRGWVGVVGLLTESLLCLQELTSPERSLCNSFRCNTYEPLASVDSKRLAQTLNPLDATLTKKLGGVGVSRFCSCRNVPTLQRATFKRSSSLCYNLQFTFRPGDTLRHVRTNGHEDQQSLCPPDP